MKDGGFRISNTVKAFLLLLLLVAVAFASVYKLWVHDDYSEPETIVEYQRLCSGCHGSGFEDFHTLRLRNGNSVFHIMESIADETSKIPDHTFDRRLSDDEVKHLARLICDQQEMWILDTMLSISTRFKQEDLIVGNTRLIIDTVAVIPDLEDGINGWSIPWGIGFLKDGSILVTERSGSLFLKRPNTDLMVVHGVPESFETIHGGLLDVEVLSDAGSSARIVLTHSYRDKLGFSGTAITEGTLVDDSLIQTRVIYKGEAVFGHYEYGSRARVSDDGFLYVTFGHRGIIFKSLMNLDVPYGKIHRFDLNGNIPDSNPFSKNSDAIGSIYTTGHRNAQGLAIDPSTGDIWCTEHGPRGGDELNMVVAGLNYGWPIVTHGREYDGTFFSENHHLPQYEPPVFSWTPSIAVSGMEIVSSERYPEWLGDLIICSMKFRCLYRLELEDNRVVNEQILLPGIGRVREVQMGPDGLLYLCIEGGVVVRLIPY